MNFSTSQKLRIRFNQFRYRSKTSNPYLSGDAFREISDIAIESLQDITDKINSNLHGNIIFCKSDLLDDLITSLGSHQLGLSLIAGNSDRNFESEISKSLECFDSLYLQNSLISDNKRIFTLPIGVENLRLGINGLPKNLRSKSNWRSRKKTLLIGPFSPNHKSRFSVLEDKSTTTNFTILRKPVSPREYSEIVNEHRFVLCPRGNGIDTHRFWETLYRGSIPIVFKDKWSESLLFHGFPFIQVEDFSHETINNAINKFEESNNFDSFDPLTTESLWIDYWVKLLRKK